MKFASTYTLIAHLWLMVFIITRDVNAIFISIVVFFITLITMHFESKVITSKIDLDFSIVKLNNEIQFQVLDKIDQVIFLLEKKKGRGKN